jgi:hypothetical protein
MMPGSNQPGIISFANQVAGEKNIGEKTMGKTAQDITNDR